MQHWLNCAHACHQEDLHLVGSQLTWFSDAFLLPVAALELGFGVLGDVFGRKRLLVIGGLVVAAGEFVTAAAPAVQAVWVSQVVAGLGAIAVPPAPAPYPTIMTDLVDHS